MAVTGLKKHSMVKAASIKKAITKVKYNKFFFIKKAVDKKFINQILNQI